MTSFEEIEFHMTSNLTNMITPNEKMSPNDTQNARYTVFYPRISSVFLRQTVISGNQINQIFLHIRTGFSKWCHFESGVNFQGFFVPILGDFYWPNKRKSTRDTISQPSILMLDTQNVLFTTDDNSLECTKVYKWHSTCDWRTYSVDANHLIVVVF